MPEITEEAFWHERVLRRMDRMDDRLNRLESRINYLFGGLALLVVLANLALQVRLI